MAYDYRNFWFWRQVLTEIVGSSVTDKFAEQLKSFGITPSKVHRNLTVDQMVDFEVQRKEGVVYVMRNHSHHLSEDQNGEGSRKMVSEKKKRKISGKVPDAEWERVFIKLISKVFEIGIRILIRYTL
jgi:hypothetical protein